MGVFKRIDRDKNGNVVSTGKVWWINYTVAGRQKRESSFSTNKRVALNLLAMRQGQVLEGRLALPKSRPPKFEEWTERFLEHILTFDEQAKLLMAARPHLRLREAIS